ncbi:MULTISPECIES: Na+/H+ antiporter subunit E [unclassified Candidatus Tisiphia]|jgi:multicomponent Na+:H+ antiporter subunit E|uniref:Na+/H+ antiporter subunit E n=2 Tax=unclassified Candidatus Tisiphia TaxID=2996318 RepID=UPI0035C92387
MMPTKIFTLIMLLLILFGLTGLPTDVFTLLISSIIVSITYLFAIKLNLMPRRVYLNYHSILYFTWLIKEILLSSLGVMKIIWRKNLNLQPVFEWIDSEQKNDTSLVVYANSITLTPGTVTLDIANNMLLVHALEQSSIDNLKFGDSTMSKRVQQICCRGKEA